LADIGYTEDIGLSLGTYSKDQVHGVDGNVLYSDYFITRSDGTRVVINFGSHNDNIKEERDKLSIYKDAGIPCLLLMYSPLEIIDSETFNYMLERIQDDLEAGFEEANNIEEVQNSHRSIMRDAFLKFSLIIIF